MAFSSASVSSIASYYRTHIGRVAPKAKYLAISRASATSSGGQKVYAVKKQPIHAIYHYRQNTKEPRFFLHFQQYVTVTSPLATFGVFLSRYPRNEHWCTVAMKIQHTGAWHHTLQPERRIFFD
jgi:hypothetical protein